MEKMALDARSGPTWAVHPGGSSLGISALQCLLQRCLVVSAHLLSLRSTTSRQSSQTRSTAPVIHSQKHLPCPPMCIILAPWFLYKGVKSKNFTLPLISCVSLSKSLSPSVPPFPHL